MKKVLTFILLLFTLTTFHLVGCEKKPSYEETAENFAKKVLTVPYQDISEVVHSDLMTQDIEEYDKKLNEAIENLCGDIVPKDILTDTSSTFFDNVIMLHLMAAGHDFTYTVENIEITQYSDKKYNYTAEVIASNREENLTLQGLIQFNDSDKIDYMTIKGLPKKL